MDLMEWIKIHEDIRALLSEPLADGGGSFWMLRRNKTDLPSQTYIELEHLPSCFTALGGQEDQICLPNVALFLIALLTCQQGYGILLHFSFCLFKFHSVQSADF